MWRRTLPILVALWLAACTAAPTASPTPPTTGVEHLPTATASPRPATATRRPTITPTSGRTATPSASATVSATATPSITPTPPGIATAASLTPAPAAVCVPTDPDSGLLPTFLTPPEGHIDLSKLDLYLREAADYLDSVGPQGILTTLADLGQREGIDYVYVDLTNDGVPELALSLGLGRGPLTVFGCQAGHYQILLSIETDNFFSPDVLAAIDLDHDGQRELVTEALSCGLGACLAVNIWGWNGAGFESMVNTDLGFFTMIGGTFSDAPSAWVQDVDGDGFVEVLLTGGIPSGNERDFEGPWRVETDTYAWNGAWFVARTQAFTSPEYRFQALQDADLSVSEADYAAALANYLAVINDDTLDWWSPTKKDNWIANSETRWTNDPTPTPLPGDGGLERTQLSAYAYFRLALLHLLQGQPAEAQAAYDTLQAQYAASAAGRPYAELGAAFWSAYTADQSIPSGCAAAQAYAAVHPDLLTPLGSAYHGWQSPTYTPAMICPFP